MQTKLVKCVRRPPVGCASFVRFLVEEQNDASPLLPPKIPLQKRGLINYYIGFRLAVSGRRQGLPFFGLQERSVGEIASLVSVST